MLEMIPLWVNLPTKDKMTPPGYQTVLATEIPSMTLRGDAGQIRVIARSYDGLRGSIPRT
jgi:redox-sensitive bicupin YhaK (pirin superfamily)